ATEKHYTPQEVADIYHVSTDTVYRWFRKEPGVIEIGNDERLHKRKKKLLRIPHSVLVRFHEQQRTVKHVV
ncbi:MAG TPA: helix-turn-helix domain-containing protein, partial [Terriglobales bacterium]